ncbi:Uncharacterised protein [Klebsiella quasipneumoniae]|nr:Uncharacterised protein [Klebsiella quasipneumoniae]
MTAQISAYGRLVADVQSRTTSNGNPMAFMFTFSMTLTT